MFDNLLLFAYNCYEFIYCLLEYIFKIFFTSENKQTYILYPQEKKPDEYKNINSSSLQIFK